MNSADPTIATAIGQSPTSTTDPTISASQGGDTSTGTQGGTPIQDFITHAVNQATFQLPEGIAKGTPTAKKINSLLGNLPSSLIDSAGGKQKLLDTLNRKSTAGTVGDIAGLFGPGGIEAKLGKNLLKAGIVGAGEQGVRSLLSGDKNIGESMALGGLGGGIGYGLGKGASKLLGAAAKDPGAALAEITNTAKKTYLANTIPDLSTRDFKKWVSRGIGGAGEVGAPEAARREIAEVYSAIRENGLDNKLAQDAFRKAQPARWKAVNEAVQGTGLKISDMGEELASLPEVQKYQEVMKATGGRSEDLTDIINKASGKMSTPEGMQEGPVKSFYDTRSVLNSQAEQAMNYARNSVAKAGDYQPEQQRALAHALQAVDDAYFKKATGLVPPELAKGMKGDWATAKLLGVAASRGETSIGGFRLMPGSFTAARQNPLGLIGLAGGQLAQNAVNAVSRPIMRGIAGATVDALGNPIVNKALGTGIQAAGKIANPAMLSAGGAALAEGNENGPPGPPPIQGNGEGTSAPGGAPNGPGLGGMTLQSLQTSKGPNANVYQAQPGQISSVASQTYNMQHGYPNSSMDDAIMQGIDKMFQLKYKNTLAKDPQLQQTFYNDYKNQMLKNMHTKPGKALDTQLAARVLFPGQAVQQEQFMAAANQNLQLTQLLHGDYQNGQPAGNGALDTAGILGFVPRATNAGKLSSYDTLKSMIVREGGTNGASTFDKIMNNPLYSRSDKELAIRKIFESGPNAAGWQYYKQAIGGGK